MKHLTTDEIIEFVSAVKPDETGMELCAAVNEHIKTCSECLKRVQAFQLIHDEFNLLCSMGDFREYAYSKENIKNKDKWKGYR